MNGVTCADVHMRPKHYVDFLEHLTLRFETGRQEHDWMSHGLLNERYSDYRPVSIPHVIHSKEPYQRVLLFCKRSQHTQAL